MRSQFASEWQDFPADLYLDARHRNWVLSEETGDVVFVSARGVFLVHRHRAEHIANALAAVAGEVISAPLQAPVPVRVSAPAAPTCRPAQTHATAATTSSRRRDVLGWLGIVAGGGVYVAALALPLDDAALVVALAVGLRSGRRILAV